MCGKSLFLGFVLHETLELPPTLEICSKTRRQKIL
jgi:hypothetical protein